MLRLRMRLRLRLRLRLMLMLMLMPMHMHMLVLVLMLMLMMRLAVVAVGAVVQNSTKRVCFRRCGRAKKPSSHPDRLWPHNEFTIIQHNSY